MRYTRYYCACGQPSDLEDGYCPDCREYLSGLPDVPDLDIEGQDRMYWLNVSSPLKIDTFAALDDKLTDIRRRDLEGRCKDDANRPTVPDRDLFALGKHRGHGVCWQCGDTYEFSVTREQTISGIAPDNNTDGGSGQATEDDREKYRQKAAYRAQRNIRRLCNTNNTRYLWTLTMAPPSKSNNKRYATVSLDSQRDYDEVRRLWKQFLKRWRRHYKPFQWILVLELHDSEHTDESKRGTYHLHFATRDFIPAKHVWACWGHGQVDYQDFDKPKIRGKGEVSRLQPVRNPGAYISKYVGKCFSESDRYRKRYSCSRDVARPRKMALDEAVRVLKGQDLKEVFRTMRKTEQGDYVGESFTWQIINNR